MAYNQKREQLIGELIAKLSETSGVEITLGYCPCDFCQLLVKALSDVSVLTTEALIEITKDRKKAKKLGADLRSAPELHITIAASFRWEKQDVILPIHPSSIYEVISLMALLAGLFLSKDPNYDKPFKLIMSAFDLLVDGEADLAKYDLSEGQRLALSFVAGVLKSFERNRAWYLSETKKRMDAVKAASYHNDGNFFSRN